MRQLSLLTILLALWLLAGCDRGAAPRSTAPPPTQAAVSSPAAAATAGTPAPTPVPVARTITDARKQPLGAAVTVGGTVTAGPSVFDARGRKFYVQDGTWGIAVFFNGGGLRLAEGDTVSATGTLTAFNSELEIVLAAADAVKVTGKGRPVEPAAVKTGDIRPSDYGRLVTVSGGVHQVVRGKEGEGFWMDDGSGGVQVQVIPAGLGPLPQPGDAVTVTGITSRSKGTFQVLPRRRDEITVTGHWTDPEQTPAPLARPGSTRPEAVSLKIVAVYPHTYEDKVGEGAEAVRVQNLGDTPVDLSLWMLTDNAQLALFPPGTMLQPGQRLWITRDAQRFEVEFDTAPDFVFGSTMLPAGEDPSWIWQRFALSPSRPAQMGGGWLRLANLGGEVSLLDPEGAVADAVVYGLGNTGQPGWRGPAVQPYLFDYFVWPAGQVLYRKPDQATGRPQQDSDSAADWAQDPDDLEHGRRLLYAGWTLDEFFFPASGTEQATTQFLLAPDNLFAGTAALIDSAQQSIDIEVYTFSHPQLLERIIARQKAGVKVRVLLDGGVFASPDGSYPDVRWTAQQIARNGGQAWFWTDDPASRVRGRYNNRHQKFIVVDDARVLITSENFQQSSMPADPKADGTTGNRGAGIITDAPGVVARLRAVFAADADPRRKDIQPVAMDVTYSPPEARGDLSGYTVQKPSPLTVTGPLTFEVVQAPEHALRTADALIGMVRHAGAGDAVLVQQQYDYVNWSGNKPNPRLAAYIAAARRGATVLLLLDTVNDRGDNEQTMNYVRNLAQQEGLRIEARLGKPAGGPVHNKMVLATSGADGYVHVSSINGSENSSVFNREMGLQVRSLDAFRYFAQVFAHDWRAAGGTLPVDTRSPGAPAVKLSPTFTRASVTLTAEGDAEYFLDADPGPGKGIPLRGTATVDTASLAEGAHVAYVRRRDRAGAWGAIAPAGFTVVRTPPELAVGFDPNSRRLTLTAAGPYSTTAKVEPDTVRAGVSDHTVADGAGNTLVARLNVEEKAGRVRVVVERLRYNDGEERRPGANELVVEFAGDGSLTRLTGTARAADGAARSSYDAEKNLTTIEGGATRPGPRTLGLRTEGGQVRLAR